MKERRSLVEGLAATPEVKDLEAAFVFGSKKTAPVAEVKETPVESLNEEAEELTPPSLESTKILPHMKGRIHITSRCRPEVASALKRASLKRQLAGQEPHYVQDIIEEALESWLRNNGYIS